MIHDFLLWWKQQIFSLLPARFAGESSADADAALISPVGGPGSGTTRMLALTARRGGKTSQHGQFSCDVDGLHRLARRLADLPSRLLLALPPGFVLGKTLTLPAAVEGDLDRVLGYGMDVETPFTADQVYWSWSVEARDRARGKIVVSLALIPQAKLRWLLDPLLQNDVMPQAIVAPRRDGSDVLLPLAVPGTVRATVPLGSRALWAVCLLLALLAIVFPFVRQSLALRDADRRIAAVRAPAGEAQALLARMDGSAGGGGAIFDERARLADPLRVLAELTDVLPDDTFISDFHLQGQRLTISGQSAAATRLIGILAGSRQFRDPSFAAPVTTVGTDAGAHEHAREHAREQFSIGTDVRGAP